MSYKEKIENIINQRKGLGIYAGKGHLKYVQDKLVFFKKLLSELEEYKSFHENVMTQIKTGQGEHFSIALDDPLYSSHVEDANPNDAIVAVKRSIDELKRLELRFNRDTINISVVGRAGQGKSRLLQSISGLANEIIPADNGGDCTGAKSVICNSPEGLHAKVIFLSEHELVDNVQKYLDALGANISIGAVSQIPCINVDSIEIGSSNKKESYRGQLGKYVSHYDEYAGMLNSSIDISDRNEIRKYVSQYLVDGQPTYAYLGVKEVQIFTPFNYSDAGKIMLVDTIGLGDTSIGLREKVVETMINDSDAAILLRRPDPARDGVREEDNELYDLVNEKMEGRDIEKWLFYVLNIYGQNQKSGNILYEQLQKKFGKTLKAAYIKKVDCADTGDVEKNLLVPLLDILSQNLSEVDNSLMNTINNVCEDTFSVFCKLVDKIDSVISECSIVTSEEEDLFDKLYDDDLCLSTRIKELSGKYYEQRNEICEILNQEIRIVLRQMKTHLPSIDQIQSKLNEGGQRGLPTECYHFFISNLRTIIRDEFENAGINVLEQLQSDVKNEIIQVLKDNDGGKLERIQLTNKYDTADAWLSVLIAEKTDNYPIVKRALSAIKDYRINIEGLLEYKVNIALDYLDCEYPKNQKFKDIEIDDDIEKSDYANLIAQSIENTLPLVAEELTNNVQELLNIPYNSYCALVRKFYDRLFYDKYGSREFKQFYRKNKHYIWKESFHGLASRNEQMKKWETINESILEKKNYQYFNIAL